MTDGSPKICGGYILLSRKLIENEIMRKPPLYAKVWIWMLLQAQHKEYKDLKRGQLRASIPEIQDAMSYMVGFRKVKPTHKEVRQIIEWMRTPCEHLVNDHMKGSMIGTVRGIHKMTITIENFCFYQDPNNYEGHSEKSMKELRRAKQGHTMNKNDKNDKKDSSIPYQKIIDLYHDKCTSLPAILKLTGKRRKVINARWNENGSIDFFSDYFVRVERSDFLTGRKPNDRNWKSDFDWIMNEQNMAKVLEGKYDGKQQVVERKMEVYR